MAGLTYSYNNKKQMKEQPSKTNIGLDVVELALREAARTTANDNYLLKLAQHALGSKQYCAEPTPLCHEFESLAKTLDPLTRRNKCACT